jgi:hypothetical protein
MLTSDNWLETAPDSEPLTSYTNYTSTSLANTSNRDQHSISDVDSDSNLPFDAQVAPPRMFGDSPTLPYARPNATRTLLTSLSDTGISRSVFSPEQPSTPTPMQPRKRPRFTPINWDSQSSGFRQLPQEALQPVPPRTQIALNSSVLAPQASNGINLLSPASALPDRLRELFPFAYFNAMQSEAFPSIYETDKNIVLSAPTASGKTTCFDFAIARLMRNEGTSGKFKVCIINFRANPSGSVYRPD